MSREFTLGKKERIKHRKFVEQIFREGQRFSVFPFRVFYILDDEIPVSLQAGFSVSVRNFKKAVDRNRIKRVTRECYRLQKNELKNLLDSKGKKLAVFFIYTDKTRPAFGMAKEKINIALQKLATIINEMDSAGS